jgi:hypothetical protein
MARRPLMPPFFRKHTLSLVSQKASRFLIVFAIAASFGSHARADTSELEVYRSDITDEGELNFDFAGNVMRAPRHSDTSGQAIAQAIGELSFGMGGGYDIGIKVPVSYSNGAWIGKSLLGEVKYIAPHEKMGWYWGAEAELGYFSAFDESQQWTAEIAPIIGFRTDKWEFVLNPGLTVASGGDKRGVVEFEPSTKVAYQVVKNIAIGVEYFSEAGRMHAALPGCKRNELAFLALDTKIGKSTINFGIGHGVNSYSPGFAMKAVLDLEFD